MKTHYYSRKSLHRILALFLPLFLLLEACAPAKADATPTMSVREIYTSAYQTISAQQVTQMALTPPTSTATATVLPTLPPLPTAPLPTLALATSAVPSGGGTSTACDSAVWAGDVTIPDGTVVAPGKKFTKTWKLLNKGTCTWGTGYKLVFDSGDQMNGSSTPVTGSVTSGSVTQISVDMNAPLTNGTYKGFWRMHNASDQAFGDAIFVLIKVGAGSAATAAATGTACSGTCTISGSFGVSGSKLQLDVTGSGASAVTIDANAGTFSFTVPSGWSGKITPSKGTYSFNPSSISFSNVTQNMPNQNFTASPGAPTNTPKPTP